MVLPSAFTSAGGLGLLLIFGGTMAGGFIGAKPAFRQDSVPLRALMCALYIGFFGGWIGAKRGRSTT